MAEALADKVLSQLLSKEDAEAGKKAYEVLETYKGKRCSTTRTVRNNLEALVKKSLIPDFLESPPL